MLNQQPLLFSGFPAADFDQHKTSGEFFTVQNELQLAAIELLLRREISFHFEAAVVPYDHIAGAIIALRYFALKLGVFEWMIFGLNCEAFVTGIHRWAFGHGPGFHRAIYFQAEIVVKPARVMFLNDKIRSAM